MIDQWVHDGVIYKKRKRVSTDDSWISKHVQGHDFAILRSKDNIMDGRPMFVCQLDNDPGLFGAYLLEVMHPVQIFPALKFSVEVTVTNVNISCVDFLMGADSALERINGYYSMSVLVEPTPTEVEVAIHD